MACGEIILINDGIESCQGDPCALVKEWRTRAVKIRVHVVGLGLDEKSRQALQCISEAAGTEYHDASTSHELRDSLARIQQEAMSRGFFIEGVDAAGRSQPIEGTLTRTGTAARSVASGASFLRSGLSPCLVG